MKRLFALLLSAVFFSGALFSCAHSAANKDGDIKDGFAKKDYKGEQFTFLTVKHTQTASDYYGGGYIDSDTYTGSTVSDAVYERNLAVEEYYNVKVSELVRIGSDPWDVIHSYRLAGDICFDAVYGWGYKLAACIPKGAFTSIGDLPGVDLSKSYWSPSAVEDLEIDGKLYVACCDISMNKIKWANVIFCNNTVAEGLNLESSPSELCLDGGWTYDRYLRLATDAAGLGKTGIVSKSLGGLELAHGAGIYFAKVSDDGAALFEYSERLQNIIEATSLAYSDNSTVIKEGYISKQYGPNQGTTDDPWDTALEYFCCGNALFCSASASYASQIKASGADYTILPLPKYSKEQDNYNSTVSHLASMIAVLPETRGDVKGASHERTGVILEYMAYKSQEILYPSFTESILYEDENGNVREDDKRILNIIRDSARYEFTSLFGLRDASLLANEMFLYPKKAERIYTERKEALQKELNEIYESISSDD